MQPIHGPEVQNRISGSKEEGNWPVLSSVKITNTMEEYMAVLCCIFITIDEDNDTAPENIPEQQQQHQGNRPKVGEVWKSEGIICPRKAKDLQNYFACFRNYTKEDVLKIRKLDIFLVLFPVGYLDTILIPQKKKFLRIPQTLMSS